MKLALPWSTGTAGAEALKRLAVFAILALILLLPLSRMEGLLWERQSLGWEVESEIARQWGQGQRIAAPILALPYRVFRQTADGKTHESRSMAYFLPETLEIDADLVAEERRRSVYGLTVYGAKVGISGRFGALDLAALGVDEANAIWSEASLILGISDMSGIRALEVEIDGQNFRPEPGLDREQLLTSGAHVALDRRPDKFAIDLAINGSREMMFLPLGRDTVARLVADWPHPSFVGTLLPAEREIDAEGFAARWQTTYLARDFPQAWRSGEFQIRIDDDVAFGVALVQPGDRYQQVDRIGKYNLLVIALAFGTLFLFGLLTGARAHPMQALMIGAALCLFYLLLLALAEHLPFAAAYAIAAGATASLNAAYIARTLGARPGALLGAMLAAIYGFLYVLLQAEDYSLLMGATGLFAVLALAMYLTRAIDWYGLAGGPKRAVPDAKG